MRICLMAHISKIITINGASNTGKTTVSDLLTHIRPMTVKIELDSLGVGHTTRHLPQATKDYILKKFGNTILEDCATLAINWIDRECDVVYPGLFPIKGFEEFRTHLEKRLGERQVEYYCFTLKPPLEIALRNRGPRILDEKEKEFITDLYSGR